MDKKQMIKPDDVNENTPFIFVSYSRKDIEIVQKILQIFRKNRIRFLYDMGVKSGAEWAEELGTKIEQCVQFIVIITESSIESKYVRKEISMAVENKLDGQILVLYSKPIKLTGGMQLLLGNIQAISQFEYTDEINFEEAICRSISKEVLYNEKVEVDSFLMNQYDGFAEKHCGENYTVLDKIGQGGTGTVYYGYHNRTDIPVVIKRGRLDTAYQKSVVETFFRNELYLLSQKLNNCPDVPTIMDYFLDDENIILVETFIEGKTLKSIEREYTEEEIVILLKKLLNILSNIHKRGIIYKDMKPANIIEDDYGRVYLIDFGISWDLSNIADFELRVGTIGYCSPEQYLIDKSEHTDFSSDLYALGRTIEYLLLQENFDYGGIRTPLRVYRRDISVEFEKIIWKMTEPERKNRYRTTDEILVALEHYHNIGFIKKNRTVIYFKAFEPYI